MDPDPLPSASPAHLLFILLSKAVEFHSPAAWTPWICIVLIAAFCLMASAFVSGSEIAYFGLHPSDIDDLSESDDPSAKKAYNMLSQSERLLATILISNNLVNITMVVLMTFAINQTVTFNSTVVNFLVQTVFLTFLLLLFGEIFPKLVARGRTLKWVMATSPVMGFLFRIFGPLARLMVKSTYIINRVVRKKEETVSADELEKVLERSDLQEGKDKEMLEGILTFGEKEVSDIMISRVDVTAIEYHDPWDKALETVLRSGFSRIPVYDTSQDTIRGILYSKDILPHIGKRDNTFHWQTLLRQAYFVPESRMIDDLLEDFRKRKIHIAVVVDEYGGTQGIVTLEDIIEEIVGDIDDEYDQTQAMFRRLGRDLYVFDAKEPIGDLCHVLGIEEEELGGIGDAETLAGLILEIKGDFPSPNEQLRRGPCVFTVLGIERHRITRVKVKLERENSGEETPRKD